MSIDTKKGYVTLAPNTVLPLGLLCQLKRDAIDIEVTRGGDVPNPFDASIFTMITLDELYASAPSARNASSYNDVIYDYFEAIGLDSADCEWTILKNNTKGDLVSLGKYSLASISTCEGLAYVAKKDLLQLLDGLQDDTILNDQVELLLAKYNAWRGDRIYNATLTYRFDNSITNSVTNVLEIEDFERSRCFINTVNALYVELVDRIRKEACTLRITIDLNKNDLTDIDGYESPFQYIEQQFQDNYGIRLSMVCTETPLVFNDDSETLFIGDYKYSIARKELSFTVDPNRVPLFQKIYDKTLSPLIRYMSESLNEASDYGWIVMKDLMSGNPLQEWNPSVVDAFWDAMFRDIPHAYNPLCEIKR